MRLSLKLTTWPHLSAIFLAFLVQPLSVHAAWLILDDFANGTIQWEATSGIGNNVDNNSSLYTTAEDPLKTGNQVLSYTNGDGKGIYYTLDDAAVQIGGKVTFYFEWFLPVNGNFDVGVGMSDEAIPTPTSLSFPTPDYPDLLFRAQASDDNPFVHFKVQSLPEPSNSGIWEVTSTPLTEGRWWSYWMVIENLGRLEKNEVKYYASPLGESPNFHWTGYYQPSESTPIESILIIGGGNGLNTDITMYDNFALAGGELLTTPVPEPSAYTMIIGLLSIAFAVCKRCRFIASV